MTDDSYSDDSMLSEREREILRRMRARDAENDALPDEQRSTLAPGKQEFPVGVDADATQWEYLLHRTREEAAVGQAGLTRVPAGGAVALAEYVTSGGTWEPDDRPWRVKYQGSDYDFLEIPVEEAEALLRHWVQIGRIERYPDPASSFTEEQRAALLEADRRAAEVWSAVEMPPGADEISLP